MTTLQPKPERASFEDASKFAENLDEQQLFCREKGHRCDIPHTAKYEPAYKVFVEEMRCKCGVIEYKEIDRYNGHIVVRKLDYREADGYLMTGLGRNSADSNGAFRVERRLRRPEYDPKKIRDADRRYKRKLERQQREAMGEEDG